MECVLLCAGYATRLYPLTKDRAKPLLPVGGVPLIERTITTAAEIEGLGRIVIVTNHRFADPFREWLAGWKDRPELDIEVLDDGTTSNEDRLGAIGDIRYAIRHAKIDDDLLVLAGDNLIRFSLAEFARQARGITIALKDLKNLDLASLYGIVSRNAEGRVTSFEEKPKKPKSSLASIGVYLIPRTELGLIDRYLDEGNTPDQPGNLIGWLVRNSEVTGYTIQGQWFDIGDLESYREANRLYGS